MGSEGELYKCWDSVGNKMEVTGTIFDYANPNGRVRRWLDYDPFTNDECRAASRFRCAWAVRAPRHGCVGTRQPVFQLPPHLPRAGLRGSWNTPSSAGYRCRSPRGRWLATWIGGSQAQRQALVQAPASTEAVSRARDARRDGSLAARRASGPLFTRHARRPTNAGCSPRSSARVSSRRSGSAEVEAVRVRSAQEFDRLARGSADTRATVIARAAGGATDSD